MFAPQQSFIINNNVNVSAIKIVAHTPFPPSATGRPQQQQLQRDPTMAMAVAAIPFVSKVKNEVNGMDIDSKVISRSVGEVEGVQQKG